MNLFSQLPTPLLLAAIAALLLSGPFAKWWVDNRWRTTVLPRKCSQCGRSWWLHRTEGALIRCPGRQA